MKAIPIQPLRQLNPGDSLELSATWDTDIAALSPGDYSIEAELVAVQLRCCAGTLRLT